MKNHELGLCIEVEEGAPIDAMRVALSQTRPDSCSDCTVSKTHGAIFIIRPGVELNEHLE